LTFDPVVWAIKPEPSALNPKLQTLDPKP